LRSDAAGARLGDRFDRFTQRRSGRALLLSAILDFGTHGGALFVAPLGKRALAFTNV
jgi:hypothetical protein